MFERLFVKPSVLFVCLGNICRSPLAEAAFRQEAGRIGLDADVDSAGTGDWHIGHPPDPRAQAAALRNGIDIAACRARQVGPEDFRRYSHIVALDVQNLADLDAMRPHGSAAALSLLLDHVDGRGGGAVPDPYHGTDADFDETWALVVAGAAGLARAIAAEAGEGAGDSSERQ